MENYRSKIFRCPYCAESIALSVNVNIAEIKKASNGLTESENEILEYYRSTGVLDSYIRALETARPDYVSKPRSVLGLVHMLRANQVINAEPSIKNFLELTYGKDKNIQIYNQSEVAAIVVDGQIKQFIPTAYLKRKTTKHPNTNKVTPSYTETEVWIRTKFGYVANTLFWQELQKHSIGDFQK